MQLSEKAEEILEELWLEKNEKGHDKASLRTVSRGLGSHEEQAAPAALKLKDDPDLKTLLEGKLVALHEGKALSLTIAGEQRGREIVRQHRLAERLLADVLDMSEAAGDKAACRFEHVLKRGLDERICTLLGHPHFCPHGSPIPPGDCCQEKREASVKIVAPLSEMEEGEGGTIAYIHTSERGRMDRLLALGVLPGQPITLVQRFPSSVFRIGQTQVAVDADLASNIYVRLGRPSAKRRWRRRGIFR